MSEKWTLEKAVKVCRRLEEIAPKFGAHVALTGGTLYKDGERKDVDILFYRIRQIEEIDVAGLMAEVAKLGIILGEDFGWCYRASYKDHPIDFFFPERPGATVRNGWRY